MMKLERRFCAPLTALAAFVLSCVSLTAQADTLVDIYELALENDALLKAKVAQYGADLELENLALAPLLPQATAAWRWRGSLRRSRRPSPALSGRGRRKSSAASRNAAPQAGSRG